MVQFTQKINGIDFVFEGFWEGNDEVCRVSVDGQHFRMIIGEDGSWSIWQQVPGWIKNLEKELSEAIEKVHS